jgi:hypothetical protein
MQAQHMPPKVFLCVYDGKKKAVRHSCAEPLSPVIAALRRAGVFTHQLNISRRADRGQQLRAILRALRRAPFINGFSFRAAELG